jgi:hypothetical protein
MAALLLALTTGGARAQTRASISLQVKETAGIRRNNYPVTAHVPFAQGALKGASNVRLMLNDMGVTAQVTPESMWPDGSIKLLAVDFNTNIAPLEEQTFRLDSGDDVKAQTAARGLTVIETADAIQVGNVRFNKKLSPLVTSVKYREEDIGTGVNGFTVTDATGTSHEFAHAQPLTVDIVKKGPLSVLIRYTGRLPVDVSYSVPFTITLEMPSGKTWVKYTASVEDPGRRLREIALHTPLAFSGFPWLWDFGTGSWTYGSFRSPTDSVVLTQTVKTGRNNWQIITGPKGQEQLYETAAADRPKIAEGWGHIQDGKEVVAFAFDSFGRQPGTYTMSFDGQGQASCRFVPASPVSHYQMTGYEHYVASPTPIGAVTGPVAMLNPLTVTLGKP